LGRSKQPPSKKKNEEMVSEGLEALKAWRYFKDNSVTAFSEDSFLYLSENF